MRKLFLLRTTQCELSNSILLPASTGPLTTVPDCVPFPKFALKAKIGSTGMRFCRS